MSFDFNNNIDPINKAQSAYKDGGGLGGGGMYMKQKRKRKEELDEAMFTRRDEENPSEIFFSQQDEPEIAEKDIPKNTLFNKFVNWFRLTKE